MRKRSEHGPTGGLRSATTGALAGLPLSGLVLAGCVAGAAWAGPGGGEVVAGNGSIRQEGSRTTIDQASDRLAIDWESFDVSAHETVRFNQPDAGSVALNRIFDQSPSRIFGAIDANGRVFLLNPNGMVFGSSARINVAGLLASSASMSVSAFMDGDYRLEDDDAAAGIIRNQGLIQAADGGFVVLFGEGVHNEGVILAELGSIDLAAGKSATLDFNGDGLLLFEVDEALTENLTPVGDGVTNTGELIANGGRIVMTAAAARDVFTRAVNNEGIVRASRIDDTGGVIRLVSGGDTINAGVLDASGDEGSSGGRVEVLGDRTGLADGTSIDVSGGTGGGTALVGGSYQGSDPDVMNARVTFVGNDAGINADATVDGDGGEVIVWADDTTRFRGSVTARGGAAGGDGGFVEVSGKAHLQFAGSVDTRAPAGAVGTLLLDPTDIDILDGTGDGAADGDDTFAGDASGGTGVVLEADDGPTQIYESELEQIASDTSIVLQATNDITIQALISDGTLDLLTDAPASVTFTADSDGDGAGAFSMNTSDAITTAGGTVNISGASITAGSISTSGGDINLSARGDILLAGSYAGASGTFSVGDQDGGGELDLTAAAFAFSGTAEGIGGGGADTFTIGSGIDVDLRGGGGADQFDLGGEVTGTVLGEGGDDIFNVTATQPSADLRGGAGADVFNFAAGSATSGGTARGGDDGDTFNVDAAIATDLSGELGNDVFNINDGGAAGSFSGGAGSDTQSYAGSTGSVTVRITELDSIETLVGSGAVDDTIEGTNGADAFVTSGADAGSVGGVDYASFEYLSGRGGNDTFTVGHDVTGTVDGNGGSDTLALAAGTDPNSWTIDAADGGTVSTNGGADRDFTSVENLTGNAGADTFTFTAGLTGTASGLDGDDVFNVDDGGAAGTFIGGVGTDTLSYAASTGPVAVALSSFDTIETLEGSADDGDTLEGTSGADAFVTSAADAGSVGGVDYSSFENLSGQDGNDTFTLGHDVTGTVDGNGGSDTLALAAGADPNSWTIDAADGGTVSTNGGADRVFRGVENLTGNAGADTFTFTAGLTGTASGLDGDDVFNISNGGNAGAFSGGPGSDTQSYAASTGAVTVVISGLDSIETLVGSADDGDTLQGTGGGDAFVTSGADAGSLGGVDYASFENLSGLAGNDTFTLGHHVTGIVDGGAGDDTLALAAGTDPNEWTISAADGGTVSTDGGADRSFSSIENLTGNAGADTFTFAAALTGAATGLDGDDVFNINDGGSAGSFSGGPGYDTQSYAGSTAAVTVAIPGLDAVEALVGSADDGDTIQGTSGADAFVTSGADAGSVGGVDYASFENVSGLAGDDTFTLGHDVTGTLDGGAGSDALALAAGTDPNEWTINALDGGTVSVNGGADRSFTGIETLSGNAGADTFNVQSTVNADLSGGAGDDRFNLDADANGTSSGGAGNDTFNIGADVAADLEGDGGADTFVFADGATLSGSVDGGAGSDELDFGADSGGMALTLSSGGPGGSAGAVASISDGFSNIDRVAGGSGADTFTIQGNVVADLEGNEGADSFVFADGATLAGVVDGGADGDELDFSSYQEGREFVLSASGLQGTASGISGGFTGIEAIAGGEGADAFIVAAAVTAELTGNGGNDTFDLQQSFSGGISGGAGSDTIEVAAATDADLSGDGGADVFNLRDDATGTNAGGAGDDVFNVQASVTADLQGGAGNDRFVIDGDAVVAGEIDGDGGLDALDFSSATPPTNVTLTGAGTEDGFMGTQAAIQDGFDDIDSIAVAAGTLSGPANGASWVFDEQSTARIGSQSVMFAGFASVVGGDGNDAVDVQGAASGSFSFDGGGGVNDVTVTGDSSFEGGTFTLSNVDALTLHASLTADAVNWTTGVVNQAADSGSVVTAGTLDLHSAGGASLAGANRIQSLILTNDGGDVAVTNAASMTANVRNVEGDIFLNATGEDSDLTLGELVSNGRFDVRAGRNILSSSDLVAFQGATGSQAELTAGGGIGSQQAPVSFSGFAARQLPDGEAPIVLTYNLFAFVNPLGGTPIDDRGGGATVIARDSFAVLAEADAASRRDSTDIDWAAYSEEIRLFSVNNEGVQLPEDQRLDEFAALQRVLQQLLNQPEVTSVMN